MIREKRNSLSPKTKLEWWNKLRKPNNALSPELSDLMSLLRRIKKDVNRNNVGNREVVKNPVSLINHSLRKSKNKNVMKNKITVMIC